MLLTFISGLLNIFYSTNQSGPWCWISSSDSAGTIFRFTSFYLILWVCFGGMLYMYYQITTVLRRYAAMNSGVEDRLTKTARHLQWYPLIFIGALMRRACSRVNANYTKYLTKVPTMFH